MASKRCPSCGLVNPGSAQGCDCGFSFVSQTRADGTHASEPPILTPKQSVSQVARVAVYLSCACFVAALLIAVSSRDTFVLQVAGGLGLMGLIGLSIARMLWRTGRSMSDVD